MSEKDLIQSSQRPGPVSEPSSNVGSITRARSFRIKLKPFSPDREQYKRTVRACMIARISFKPIANIAGYLEDFVEIGEVNSKVKDGWQGQPGEVREVGNEFLAWQDTGEQIQIVPQLTSPGNLKGSEVIVTSQSPATHPNTGMKTLNVIEGINISNPINPALENSPFLKAPADWKKAA